MNRRNLAKLGLIAPAKPLGIGVIDPAGIEADGPDRTRLTFFNSGFAPTLSPSNGTLSWTRSERQLMTLGGQLNCEP